MTKLIYTMSFSLLLLNFPSKDVGALSKACQNSAACREAVEKEQEANKNAKEAADSANAYQAKVSELSAEIAGKEAEIAVSVAEVNDLKAQIISTEAKLTEQQEALAELLVNMHFESDAEPIKILAGATSISDLAEKAAREEVAKEQIAVSAAAVRKTKEKLEEEDRDVIDEFLQVCNVIKDMDELDEYSDLLLGIADGLDEEDQKIIYDIIDIIQK